MKAVIGFFILSIGIGVVCYKMCGAQPRVTFGDAGIDQWTPAAFSPDGARILARGYRPHPNQKGPPFGATLRLWDTSTGKPIREYRYSKESPGQHISQVAFSADGKHLFACGYDLPLVMWETDTGKEVRAFSNDRLWITWFALTPDGKTVVVVDDNGTLMLFELATGKLIKSAKVRDHYVPETTGILLSRDSSRMVLLDVGDFSLWEFPSLQFRIMGTSRKRFGPKQFLLPFHVAPMSFTMSPGGKTLFYCEQKGPIYELDLATEKVIRKIELTAVNDNIHVLAISPKGDKIMTTGIYGHGRAFVYQTVVYSFPECKELMRLPGYGKVQFSPDGNTALTFTKDGRMMLWNLVKDSN